MFINKNFTSLLASESFPPYLFIKNTLAFDRRSSCLLQDKPHEKRSPCDLSRRQEPLLSKARMFLINKYGGKLGSKPVKVLLINIAMLQESMQEYVSIVVSISLLLYTKNLPIALLTLKFER